MTALYQLWHARNAYGPPAFIEGEGGYIVGVRAFVPDGCNTDTRRAYAAWRTEVGYAVRRNLAAKGLLRADKVKPRPAVTCVIPKYRDAVPPFPPHPFD